MTMGCGDGGDLEFRIWNLELRMRAGLFIGFLVLFGWSYKFLLDLVFIGTRCVGC